MGENMPKLKIKVTVINEEGKSNYETTAILCDNILKYKENKETTVLYNYEKNSLLRENSELRMDYVFDLKRKTEGILQIKELDHTVRVPIHTKKIERNNINIEINFEIEKKDFLYCIEEIK